MGGELIVDEAFIEFCPECSVCRRVAPGLTVVGSLTKTLCIPGVRLGYVCAEPEIIAALERRALPWPMNALAVAVAAELPRHKGEIASDAALNRERRENFARQLGALDAEALPSQSNFLLVNFHRDMTQAYSRAHLRVLRPGAGILARGRENAGGKPAAMSNAGGDFQCAVNR